MYREKVIVNTADFNPIGHDNNILGGSASALHVSLVECLLSVSPQLALQHEQRFILRYTPALCLKPVCPLSPRILKAQSLQSHDSRANRQVLAGVQRG